MSLTEANNRTSPDAISAVRGIVGPDVDDETAGDVVETVRYYVERPLQLALTSANKLLLQAQQDLRAAQEEIETLKAANKALETATK